MIPGLLQTPVYATARLKRIVEFSGIPDDVETAVVNRMERQKVLTNGGRRFSIVLEIGALRSRIGSPEMMVGQLGHLISVASLPSVSLGIIPPDIERTMWSSPGFWIFDEAPVLVETPTAELRITQPREVSVYDRTFAEFSEMAVRGAKARALITAAMESLG